MKFDNHLMMLGNFKNILQFLRGLDSKVDSFLGPQLRLDISEANSEFEESNKCQN